MLKRFPIILLEKNEIFQTYFVHRGAQLKSYADLKKCQRSDIKDMIFNLNKALQANFKTLLVRGLNVVHPCSSIIASLVPVEFVNP